jgi:PTS system galactitol-specific IIA component
MPEKDAELKIEADLILTDLHVVDRWEAIDTLSELLLKKGYVTDEFAEKSKERERGFPTALPTKPTAVAIPHTWAEYCIDPAIAVGILDEPIPWIEMGTKDRLQDVQIVLLLSITEPKKQVHFLRTVIDYFVVEENIQNLLASNGVIEIQEMLVKGLNLE